MALTALTSDFIVRSGLVVQGAGAVTSSTGQVGATQINSGIAIAKNLIVGTTATIYGNTTILGSLNVTGTTNLTNIDLGNDLNVKGQLLTTGTFHAFGAAQIDGLLTLTSANASGAVTVTGLTTLNGGLTVTNATYLGGVLTVAGASTFNNSVSISNGNTLTVGTGTTTLGGLLSVAGKTTITNNTAATVAGGGDGALKVTGGAYIGNNLQVASTAFDTGTNTANALYVAGGAWVDKTLVVGGDTTFKGAVTFTGTATYVLSTNTVYTDNILHLHENSLGPEVPWTTDDGKDIGLAFHYYKGADKNAFLGFANDTSYLEWYENGTESAGKFTGGTYGTFKTANIQLVGTGNASSTLTGALTVVGGAGIGGAVYAGGNVSGATVNARNLTSTRLVIAGTGGQLTDDADLTWNATANQIEGRVAYANTASLALQTNNLNGGAAGSLVYQTGTNQTGFLPIGTNGYVLQSTGAAPLWAPLSGISAGSANTATNLAGGLANQIPYQGAPGSTIFSANLTFNGTTFQTTNATVSGISTLTTAVITHAGITNLTATVATVTNLIVTGVTSLQGATASTITATSLVSTTLNVSGLSTLQNVNAAITTVTTLTVTNGASVGGNLGVTGTGTFTGKLSANNTSDSAATNQGSIVTLGGIGVAKSMVVGGSITVGTPATNAVVPAMFSNNTLVSSFTSNTIATTSTQNLDSFSASVYRTARYLVQIVDGTKIHVTEMTIFHDGTNVYLNEYGISTNQGSLGVFDANYVTGVVTLTFTPSSATSMVIKVMRTAITV